MYKAKKFDLSGLNGISDQTLEMHFKLYEGYVKETNTLLVRSSASAWKSIREVVERLDVMPMQVHIEAQVAEVKLTGDLEYGVNWTQPRPEPGWSGVERTEIRPNAPWPSPPEL